jgi:predicted Zn-dependent protease
MNPTDDHFDDEQFEALLAAAGRDAPPPDPAILERLREQSTEVFLASSSQKSLRNRGRIMISHALRVLAASAALFLLGVGLYWYVWQRNAEPDFGQVLANAARAQTIHCRVVRDGATFEVWAEQPGRLRQDAPDGTYQVAYDGTLWEVDEKANRASSRPSPYHRSDRHELDLLALFLMPAGAERAGLEGRLPDGHAERDGLDYLVYRMEVSAPLGAVEVEALIDPPTGLPHSLQARGVRGGKREVFAELVVLAYNQAVPAEKFVVRDTLTEDGRVGKVTDTQGVVTLKPVMRQRWTPVATHLLLKPGDWIRTDARGANAAALRLVKNTRVILGPGTLLEIIKPDQLRLHAGQVEITAAKDAPVELLVHGQAKAVIKGTERYRLDREQVVRLPDEPHWLRAFKGTTNNESIGSLVAGIDGRNVPLSVGEHKVTVDVRDQIARTTIEETFVNHTAGVLEGVFHFPLPPGASVSGFAMWIGDKMIEADVVEKQRAREIYEIILQEKRDPGLLEWTGGNVFKARVYPIFANSEKRVRITYTQVLPLKGGRYRYNYALQSEMLQQHPLRELSIDVKVNSAVALKGVSCPTHPARLERTEHSAHVEFAAQEYTPTRDFEVVVETEGKEAAAVLIPHRRGDDGYFMLQLAPPAAGDSERDVLPDGRPLDVIVLADTSASVDAGQRAVQATFLATLLSVLTPKDTLNVAACDVECDWVFDKAVPATPGNVSAAMQFLARRRSLGWTDLDRAFASVLGRCGPGTQVIYIGDGIVTAGDADPVAFGKRLRALYEEKGRAGTFHAVTPGSSYEAGVLKAIASLGGGSVRHVGGEQGPAAVALELVGEMVFPTVRDLKVEFRGLRTASVYPEQLPNLPAGAQHILLGRYLPEGRDQAGEVVVTGTRGGEPVRFSARVALADAEKGNSFIPRLWARMHLDHLLEKGSTPAARDEIIALSEEYNILTPYTSLLVLESDADRERFKVKTRFRMRDGERFFAQGRDNANYELKQKQMKLAGDWRLGLHRRVLRQLAGLGRDLLPRRNNLPIYQRGDADWKDGTSNEVFFDGEITYLADDLGRYGNGAPLGATQSADTSRVWAQMDFNATSEPAGQPTDGPPVEFPASGPQAAEPEAERMADEHSRELEGEEAGKDARLELEENTKKEMDLAEPALAARGRLGGLAWGGKSRNLVDTYGWMGGMPMSYAQRPRPRSLAALFPDIPRSAAARGLKPAWPAEARALARSLSRADKLAQVKGGLEVVQQAETFDVRWGDLTSRSRKRALLSAASWLLHTEGDGETALVRWCDGRERGVFTPAFQLGRLRAAAAGDGTAVPLDIGDFSLSPLDQAYGIYLPTLEPQKDGRTLLVLAHSSGPYYQTRVLVDTERHVIVRIEHRQNGQTASVTKFEDFVEVAGSWWARRVETVDATGRLSARTTLAVQPLSADELVKQVKGELAGRDAVLFLHLPGQTVAAAKAAVAGGKPTFDDHFALLEHFAAAQQWARAATHLRECERLAAGKPGLHFLRNEFLQVSRRHEELRKRLLEDTGRLAKAEPALPEERTLVDHLLTQAGQVLEANERLALLDQLRPVFARQPAYRHALRHWTQQRLAGLHQTGQAEEALRLQKQLATDFPHDVSLQQQYAQALAAAGDYAAAYAWLERALAGQTRWLPDEEESLRGTHASLLENHGRYADLAEFLAAWVKKDPESSSPYSQYLSALVRSNQLDRANDLIAQWLREGQAPGKPAPAATARLQAAVALALGQGHNFYTNRVEERWRAPLAEAALLLASREDRAGDASQILSASQFQQTDEGRRVRKALAGRLTAGVETLSPYQIQNLLQWVSSDASAVEPAAWKQVGETLHRRWEAEAHPRAKYLLGQSLVRVLQQRNDPAALVAFLHARFQKAPEEYRAAYAAELFEALLGQPWSAEYEDLAFALLGQLSDAEGAGERLWAQVAALYRLADRMIEGRRLARMKGVEHPEKLTRTELKKKQDEVLRAARTGFAERLAAAAAREPGPLAPWLKVERLYLDTRLERDLGKVAAECWEFLGAAPKPAPEPAEGQEVARQLDEVLRARHLLTLMHLAAHKGADPALADGLRKYLDAGIALDDESPRWKQIEYQLLIALDRPKDLEKMLQAWVSAGDPDNRWRLALGYLLAEQGRVPEAIALLEAVEASDELGPVAYRTLADWYLAANRREDHERASVAVYRTTDEWQLHRILVFRLRRLQAGDGQAPTEIDREVLFQFAALLEKSSNPQQHLGLLHEFYKITRDFRLLAGMADAVVGHTAASVYPLLTAAGPVLAEIGDEATVDELAAHLAKVRTRAKTDVDRRALDLLEMLVRRRAAELKNQAGPHAEAALTALRRAFKGEWSPGEPRLMADVLAGLGAIPQEPLAREQLRQLEAMHQRSEKGTYDRLHIAQRLAETLAAYARNDQALALVQAALDEYQEARGGVLPPEANGALGFFINLLDSTHHHDRAEKVVFDQMRHPAHVQQRYWLTLRLYQVYHDALVSGGEVSLGNGQKLYQAVERRLRADLDTPDHNHRQELINLLCSLYTTAHEKKLDGVGNDLRAFAKFRLPGVLMRQTSNYQNIVTHVSQTIHNLIGPRDGVAFLLDRIDQEPAWFRLTGQDGWGPYGWQIAHWRSEAKDIRDLEKRLLPLALDELRRDLESRQARNRVLYHQGSGYFWPEKGDDFAKLAEDVLAKRPQSGPTAEYVAEYLYHGLGRAGRAIEVLAAAHKKKLLEQAGQVQLVHFLQWQNRFGDSIPLLEPLVERVPENLNYRVLLMSAYSHTGRGADLLALLKRTDAFFHQKDRWTENAMAELAAACLDDRLYAQAAAYFNEVIPLHQGTHPRRGVGNGTLSNYYAQLARAYAGQGKTVEAVDAAGGAVVSWGPTHQNRAQALEALRQVLREAPDLDGYVAARDRETASTGLDSAVVRKSMGQVYMEKNAYAKAVNQLLLAVNLQPNDAEIHRLLIDCHDKLKDKEGTILALLEAVQASRRDLGLYRELGRRLADQPKEAERAFTSIVEVQPSESESHALLAEVRQEQGRWPEAIAQWEHVARIRELEPTGLLKLAAAQVHERQWDPAAQTLGKLKAKTWPARFGDVPGEVRKLEEQIKGGKASK